MQAKGVFARFERMRNQNNGRTAAQDSVGRLVEHLARKVDYIRVDRMNYHNADWVYRKYGLVGQLSDEFFDCISGEIASACQRLRMIVINQNRREKWQPFLFYLSSDD